MRAGIALVCFLSAVEAGRSTSAVVITVSSPIANSGVGVTGLPYSGELLIDQSRIRANGTRFTQPQEHQKVWRDSRGRMRIEDFILGGVSIYDTVSRFLYVISSQEKGVDRWAIPEHAQSGRQSASEDLGTQTVGGFSAIGKRMTTVAPADPTTHTDAFVTTNETWLSPGLQRIILSKVSDPKDGDIVTRFVILSRAEPDPALFVPPGGYTIVDRK